MKVTKFTLKKNNITDFAKERNSLLKSAKTNWVLFLDNDEKLSKPIGKLNKNYDGFILNRKNYFLGNYVGTDRIVRLGKKNHSVWKREVHETWDIKNIGTLENEIIHDTASNISDYINKINNYSTLHAKANLNEGKRSNLFKIITFPVAKFFLTLIKSRNVVFSIMQSLHSYLSWTKLYFLQS